MTKHLAATTLLLMAAACSQPEQSPSATTARQEQSLVTAFASGSLIIPLDNTSQDNGTLRAFGLLDALLRANVPVHRVSLTGKAAGAVDFTVTATQREGGASLGSVSYRGGPLVVAAADVTAPALAVVDAYLAADTVTNVHVATAAFSADVRRSLASAPRIAVLRDGNEAIAYGFLNAANIKDSAGNIWSDTSPGALTLAGVAGTTGGAFDGTLFVSGQPAFDQLTSMHYTTPANDEVVREIRGWLSLGPTTHAFMECEATTTFENNVNGHFLSDAGMLDDGANPAPLTVLQPDSLFAQFDGTLTSDNGSVNALGLLPSSKLYANSSVLVAETGATLGSRMMWLTGYIDGNTSKGKVSYLTGHNYSITTPISANSQTNGVRFFLDSLYETPSTFAGSQPNVTLSKTAPARTNAVNYTFTLTYTNGGAGTAYNVRITDVLAAGLTFVSATGGGTNAAGTVTWNIGTVLAGASASVTVTVTSAEGTFANTATVAFNAGSTPRSATSNTTSTIVDRTAPDTSFSSTPPSSSNSTSASFGLVSTEAGSTFECSLDGAAFASCTTPVSLTGLSNGSHTFRARATDLNGNVDLTPASHTWTVDTVVPDTSITVSPALITNSATGTFAFTATEVATFQCSIDGAAFASCTTPFLTAALADGSHTFQVRATDTAGNVDPTPASYTWTIDTAPPDTVITSGPAALSTTSSATFAFNATEAGSTLQCSLDGSAFAACSSPLALTGLSEGAHTFRTRAVDAAGNIDPTPASYSWSVDTLPPDTAITSQPPATSNSSSAVFAFTTPDASATFQCSLDGAAFAACPTPSTLTGLSDGSHTFRVRAIDGFGNVDPTPASYTWTVDTTPPDTNFTTTPPAASNSSSATFAFTATEAGSTFQCSLDGAAFTACTTPRTLTGLSDGPHTYRVRATDTVGNVDPTPASHSWTVDTTPPNTTFTSTPPASSNSSSAAFAFTATEVGSTFQCSLDGAAFTSCTNPQNLTGLADGSHTYQVRATDPAGNVDPTPASFTWTIDTTPPDTTLTSTPPLVTSSSSASFAFTASEPGALFECSLDGAVFTTCTTPRLFAGLSDGSHTFRVRAVDALGNADPTPATYTWTVDTTPPDTTITSGPPAVTSATTATLTFTSTQPGSTFECSLDGAAFTSCTTPSSVSGLAEGAHSMLVRAIDPAGNVDPTPARRDWVVDRTAPDTTIATGPSGSTSSTSAAFTFTSNEMNVTYECNLDGAGFSACPASHSITGLTEGSHTLLVRAVDAAGNVDPTPASRTWTVDQTVPDTTITSAPSGTINVSTATITFTATEPGSTFECSLDGAAFTACTTPDALSALNDGTHVFRVRAVDLAGNVDPTPASVTFTVDASEPDTVITSGPSGAVSSTTAAFTFTSTKANSTFECSLDGATFTACNPSTTFPNLMDGSHTLSVRAIDPGGNRDPSPATRTWTVDTRAPDTTITRAPPAVTNSATADFTFTSDEATATFECSLDGASFSACPAMHTLSMLSNGFHVLLVRAVDAAGNVDATPALHTWTVDTSAPQPPRITEPVADAVTGALPRFGGTAEPGTTVTVTVDGQSVCSGVVTAAGLWTCTATTPIASGPHTATATSTDAGGNTSMPSLPRTFTVDSSKPDTVITSGPSGTVNSSSATFAVTSDKAGATFECSLDGAAFMTCTAAPTFTGLMDGAHRLEVRAVSGGVADPTPAVATWTVDTVAPNPPVITSPAANATTSSTPTFTGTAEPGSTVVVSLDGSPVCSALTDAAGNFSCAAPAAISNGPHSVTATATDPATNRSMPSMSVPFTVDGSTLDTAIIAGPSGTVRSTTADFAFSSTVLGATYECSLDGAAFVACSTPTTFANLSDGMHTLQVRAVSGMNTDSTPASRTWTVDSTPPTVPVITTPADASTIYTRTPRYSGTGEAGSTVRVSVDDQYVCSALVAADGTWSCTGPSPLSSGEHRVSATATDAAGNVSQPSNVNRFTVDIPTVMVTITSPADNALTNDSTPTITGTATPNSTVTVFIDGVAVGTTTADATGKWTFTPTTPLSEGKHDVTAKAEFMMLTSPVSDTVHLTVDTTPPVVTITTDQPNTETVPGVTIMSNEPVTYTCSLDGAAFVPCSGTYDATPGGDGNHTLVVRATDSAGNVGEATTTWTVTAPIVTRPDLYIRGGGCGCGTTETSSMAAFGLALIALASRRRRAVRRSAVKSTRVRSFAVAAMALLVSSVAHAQVAGFDIERLDLNPGASSSLIAPTGDVLPRGVWRASLLAHYEHDPLLLYSTDTRARVGSIVGNRVTAHLMGAWAPVEWLELGIQLPIVAFQRGDGLSMWGVNTLATTALGTPWLSGRFALLRQKGNMPLDLAVQLGLGLPFGSPAAYSQVSPLAVAPRVSLGRDFAPWLRIGAELGVLARTGSAATGLSITQAGTGSTFTWVASAMVKPESMKLRGELTVRGLVEFDHGLAGTEFLLGARYPIGDWVEVYAIGGPGVGSLPGTPAFRLLAGVSVSPPPEPVKPPAPVCDEQATAEALVRDCAMLDADGDGVLNGVDACIRVAGVSAYKGCPIPDTDGDGMTDDVDQCPKEAGVKEKNGCPIRDQDQDGIEDPVDACPTEAGPAERNGCPIRDQDHDTVEDSADACPTEAGPVERRGCPVKDGDQDGVEDVIDNCPTVKGAVDNAGCPEKEKQLVIIEGERLVIKEKVYFATGKSVVLARSFALLDNVAKVLTNHPEVELVRIEGHTDSQGAREMNVKLSQSRAEAVKAYLVKKGVVADRLKPVGFGPDRPTALNTTPAGREQNRRVEFNFEAVKH